MLPKLPYTHLFVGDEFSVAISGHYIQVLNTSSGHKIQPTVSSKAGPIRCAAVDGAFKHLATTTDDKKLRIWDISSLTILSERDVSKKPTEMKFTRNGSTILISDKFGDIYSYDLHPSTENEGESSRVSDDKKTGKPPASGTLLMGHASLLTTFLLTSGEDFIITADRDEHIRVSWYPEAYTIEEYCLGHEKYVSALHIPSRNPAQLISGGGDPVLKFWNWKTGQLSYELHIADTVLPFIKIKSRKGKSRAEDEDEQEEGGKRISVRERRRLKKQKAKEKLTTGGGSPAPQADFAEDLDDEANEMSDSRMDNEGETVLAIQRLTTLSCGADNILLFTAVGATAVFYCKFPDASSSSTTQIKYLDFKKPIVDIITISDSEIWVSIDAEWLGDSDSASANHMVYSIVYSGDEFVITTSSSKAALLGSLNVENVLSGTKAEMQALDIYSALVVLPKNVEREYDVANSDAGTPQADIIPVAGPGAKKPKLTRKQGRLKRKQAMLAKAQEVAGQQASEPEQDEPDLKRMKNADHKGEEDDLMET